MAVATLVKSIQNIMRQDVGVDGDAQRISQLCWMFFLKIIDDQDQELETFRDGYRSPVPAPLRWQNWAADPEGITGDDLLDFVNGELFPQLKELPVRGAPRAGVVRDVFEDAYNYMKSGQSAAAGRQQDQRNRLQQLGRPAALRRTSTSRCSTTSNRPATRASTTRRAQ